MIDRLYQNSDKLRDLREQYALSDGVTVPKSKNFHLELVCGDFNVNPEQVLLIDDDRTNIIEAAKAGYLTLHVRKGLGLSFTSMSAEKV